MVQVEARDYLRLFEVVGQKYYFVMGPPCSGKSKLAKLMHKITGYEVVDLSKMA